VSPCLVAALLVESATSRRRRSSHPWGGSMGRLRSWTTTPLLHSAPAAEKDAWAELAVLRSGGPWGEP
jgi:hypothetical protein